MGLIWKIPKVYKDQMKECKMRCKTMSRRVNMYYIGTSALILVNWWKISSTKTSHICQTHPNNSEFYIIRVFMYLKIKIWYFKNVLKVCELVGWGASTAHCACEQILYYGTNPWNVFTLILYSFIRSLWNFRFCQIRLMYPTLLIWSKFKSVFKKAKLARKYQNIKRWGFFFNTL